MEHRKDKKNRVLKDGESYRERENRYMYRWFDNDKKRHYIYAATLSELRRKEKEISQNVNDGINTEKVICDWMISMTGGRTIRSALKNQHTSTMFICMSDLSVRELVI